MTFCEDCGYNLKPMRKDAGGPAIRPVPAGPVSGSGPASAQRPQAPQLRLGERQEPSVVRSDGGVSCPACHTRNQLGHRFCVACGGPLAAPEPAPTPPPAAAPASGVAPLALPTGTQPLLPKPNLTGQESRRMTSPDGVAASAVARQVERPDEPLPAAPVVPVAPTVVPGPAPVACPRCRTVSEAGVPFCRVCGHGLGGRPEAPAPVAAAPAPAAAAPAIAAPVTPAGVAPPATTAFAAVQGAQPPAPAAPGVAAGGGRVWGRLVQLAKDGSDGQAFPINTEQMDVGSVEGAVLLRDDPYVSPRHARLSREGGVWMVSDLGSTNGIYLKLQGRRGLQDGDLILLGQQVLRFEAVMEAEQALRPALQHGVALFGTPQAPRFARLCQRTVEGVTRDVYHLYRSEVSMGRETADIVFADDPFLSRRHAVLRWQQTENGRVFSLEDAGSSNGTFVAIRGRERLLGGEVLRIGLHLFRFDLNSKEQGGLS